MSEDKEFSPRAETERILITPRSSLRDPQKSVQTKSNYFRRSSRVSSSTAQKIINDEQIAQEDQNKRGVQRAQNNESEDEKGKVDIIHKMNLFSTLKIRLQILSKIKLRWHKKLKRKHYQYLNDQSSFYQKATQDNEFVDTENEIDEETNWFEKHFSEKTILYLEYLNEKIPVFNPTNPIQIIWDFMYFLVLIVLLWLVPIKIAIKDSWSQSIPVGIFVFCLFFIIFESLINMNTGFFDTGEIIKERKKIVDRYFRKHFFIDLITVVIIIVNIFDDQNTFNFFLLFIYIKMQDLERIIVKIEESINMDEFQKLCLSLLKVLGNVLFVAHIFACLWMFIYTFFTSSDSENWMAKKAIDTSTWYSQYLYSLYFSVVTMVKKTKILNGFLKLVFFFSEISLIKVTVGFGDITPTISNQLQVIICILSILITCGVFAYSINEIGIIFQEYNHSKKEIKNNFEIINNYMEQKKIDSNLRYQIREYLDYFWKQSQANKHEKEEEIIGNLSNNLKRKLILDSNKEILNIPIFQDNFSLQFLNQMVTVIQEAFFQPYDIIYKRGDSGINCQIFFPDKGTFQQILVEMPDERSKEVVIQTYQKGAYFGMESFFTGTQRSQTIRAQKFGKLKFIDRQKVLKILEQLPEDYEKFCSIRDSFFGISNEKITKSKCQSCDSDDHNLTDCPLIHFCPSKINIIKRYNNMFEPYRNNQILRGGLLRKKKNKSLKLIHLVNEEISNFIDQNEETIDELFPDNDSDFSDEPSDNDSSETQRQQSLKINNITSSKALFVNDNIKDGESLYDENDDNSQVSFKLSQKQPPINNARKIPGQIVSCVNFNDYELNEDSKSDDSISRVNRQNSQITQQNESNLMREDSNNLKDLREENVVQIVSIDETNQINQKFSKLAPQSVLQFSDSNLENPTITLSTPKDNINNQCRKSKLKKMTVRLAESSEQPTQPGIILSPTLKQKTDKIPKIKMSPAIIEQNPNLKPPIIQYRSQRRQQTIAMVQNTTLNQLNSQQQKLQVPEILNPNQNVSQIQANSKQKNNETYTHLPNLETVPTQPQEINEFSFLPDFDQGKQFVHYFPQFNTSAVLQQFELLREAKLFWQKKELAAQNNNLFQLGQTIKQQMVNVGKSQNGLKQNKPARAMSRKSLFPIKSPFATNNKLVRLPTSGKLIKIDNLNGNLNDNDDDDEN